MHYHIIVNPNGGKGKAHKTLKYVQKVLDEKHIEYDVHCTEYAGHATDISRTLSAQPDMALIVMGGDGTVNEVLNGIQNFDNVTLGFIPAGTGNDFVRASGHPKKAKKALEVILAGGTSFIDYMQLDDRRCLNVLGAGMDVDVLIKHLQIKHLHGKMKYFAALISTLMHTRFHKLSLSIDGGDPFERSVFMVGIGNGTSIGGGLPICPNAVVDDGVLSVVLINEVKKWKIPLYLLQFLRGKHVGKFYSEQYECKQIAVTVLDDSKFEADGEIFDNPSIRCEVVPNTLKVFR